MDSLPDAARQYLLRFAGEDRALAFIEVNSEGNPLRWGGQLSRYGIPPLQPETACRVQVPLLEGCLPAPRLALILPHVQTPGGEFAEVHVFHHGDRDWVLFLNSTADAVERYQMQQSLNERALVQELQDADPEGSTPASPASLAEGTRIEVTVLACQIQGVALLSQRKVPHEALQELRHYHRALETVAEESGGHVLEQAGAGLTCVYGLDPSVHHPALEGARAALRVRERFRGLAAQRARHNRLTLRAACGLATGEATLGFLGRQRRHRLLAFGPPLDRAAQLVRLAEPEEILLDESSFARLDSEQDRFHEVTRSRPGPTLAGPFFSSGDAD